MSNLQKLFQLTSSDKSMHFAWSYVISSVSLIATHLLDLPFWYATIIVLSIGIAKEVWDGRRNSMREHMLDIVADLAGITLSHLNYWVLVGGI